MRWIHAILAAFGGLAVIVAGGCAADAWEVGYSSHPDSVYVSGYDADPVYYAEPAGYYYEEPYYYEHHRYSEPYHYDYGPHYYR